VLDAALELFATHGIDGTSVDAIAAASGVSKATIYKHWADKKALCLEMLSRVHSLDCTSRTFDSGDLLQDLIDFVSYDKKEEEPSSLRERLTPHLVAYASRDFEFAKAWRAIVMEPAVAQSVELMQRGIEKGIFRQDMDLRLGTAMLIGPMMFRKFYSSVGGIPENLAEGVAKAFWRAFAVKEQARAK
jgi:AcrR family transcriptional regulator